QLVRLRDADGDLVYEERQVLAEWPSPGPCCEKGWHTTRTIAIDRVREKLYVGIGAPCDLCRSEKPFNADTLEPLPPNPEWGAILEFELDGTGRRIFATGMRNVVGIDIHPLTNELWGDHNGYDLGGPHAPPEWIDVIRQDDFMGYPFVHGYQVPIDFTSFDAFNTDPDHLASVRSQHLDKVENLYLKVGVLPLTQADSVRIARQKRPVGLVPAHLAPLGLYFYTRELFPPRFRNAAFVALHNGKIKGSLAAVSGHKVVALFSQPDGSEARIGDFITGFVTGTEYSDVWGMPVGITADSLGNLYVTSNARNYMVLKISHSYAQGEWQHNLPDSIAAGATLKVDALVRLLRLAPDGQDPRVTVDLGDFGGPTEQPLAALGDSTFRLEATLPVLGQTGLRSISVRVSQDSLRPGYSVTLTKTITVVPAGDVLILDDALATGWQAAGKAGGQAPVFGAAGPVYSGGRAGAIQVRPERSVVNWEVELRAAEPVSPFGFSALRFAFHPGDLEGPLVKALVVSLEGSNRKVADLQRGSEALRVDLEKREWQVIEIPLEGLGAGDLIEAVRFSGNLTGTFYLDDLRLVAPQPLVPPSTAVLEEDVLPSAFSLAPNYPNPFNSETLIRFTLPARAEVKLAIYNLAGHQVALLTAGSREAGSYALRWDGRDDRGRALASGVYLYRLQAGGRIGLRKLLLLK
ncbi:MAG: T9SS type A sorting domain-containing protein, partial [Candidatus Latescibacteria bacterium]|nr:T9SS type A sorting domain-containing protein [Candidatus Latescibacterota bacterium]